MNFKLPMTNVFVPQAAEGRSTVVVYGVTSRIGSEFERRETCKRRNRYWRPSRENQLEVQKWGAEKRKTNAIRHTQA